MALCYFGISPFLFAFIRGQATQIHLTPSSFFLSLLFFFIIIFLYKSLRKESPYLVQFLHYDYGNQFIVFNSYLYKIKLHLQQLVFFNHIYNILFLEKKKKTSFFKPHLQHLIELYMDFLKKKKKKKKKDRM